MTARFGPLDGRSLSLGDGLNIITAPNESGKSSWCAFIRAMLYGVDARRRSEKEACLPWHGGAPEGILDLETADGSVTLRRSTAPGSAPMRRWSAVYTGTEDPFPLPEGSPGEAITGVTADVFCRSAFIAQGGARIGNSPDLERRMAAMVSTGAEGLSYTDADERLRQWQRERAHNARVGANAALEAELAQCEARLEDIRRLDEQARQLRLEIDGLSRTAVRNAAGSLPDLTGRLRLAEERERRAREELDKTPFGARDSRETAAELREAKNQCAELLKQARRRRSYKNYILPGLLLILAAALGILGLGDRPMALISAAAALPAALAALYRAAKMTRRAGDAAGKRQAILDRYGVGDEAALDALAADHEDKSARWRRAREELQSLRDAFQARMDSMPDTGDALARKREALAALEGRLSVLGDAAGTLERREELHQAIAENLRQNSRIDLARDLLRQAEQRHLSDFSPRLTRRTAELFNRFTGGRYDSLSLDRELNISARLRGDTLGHDSALLSAGARELLYLCLRIAICELALPPEKNIPLILDDALCTLDDGRCAAFLELLLELSRDRQIILFTCHSREAAMLRHRPGVSTPEVN